jgi:hypothetical protein
MDTTGKIRKVKGYNVERELAKIDRVFRSIDKDRSLPTFLNFFLECLICGTAQKVNLKLMYPKIYVKLDKLLKEHKARVLALRK